MTTVTEWDGKTHLIGTIYGPPGARYADCSCSIRIEAPDPQAVLATHREHAHRVRVEDEREVARRVTPIRVAEVRAALAEIADEKKGRRP